MKVECSADCGSKGRRQGWLERRSGGKGNLELQARQRPWLQGTLNKQEWSRVTEPWSRPLRVPLVQEATALSIYSAVSV